ncbi:MAG TPA: hypothetical protein VK453_13735 [Micromonosporaceae bacterium]|nr:hypothetical protein [Micromonosporaceae bacterium]
MTDLLPNTGFAPRASIAEPTVPPLVSIDPLRPSALDRFRGRRAERDIRRAELAHQRLAQRMESLGEDWRVLDLKEATGGERASFLAVGPGGLYAVTVKDHGRAKVNFAGDIVQIDGRRPKYVAEARESARIAAEALSRTAGLSIPVMAVLAFAGSGMITFYGMPKGCLVTSYQDLGRLLNARGNRLAPDTVEKLFAVATHPATWADPMNVPYVSPNGSQGGEYRWYPDTQQAMSQTDADKRPPPR